FGDTIIIAGDRSCADVCFLADPGIADVGKVIDFGPAFDGGIFDFNEIADMRMLSYAGSRSQSGKGSNDRAARNACPLEMAEASDRDVVGNFDSWADYDIRLDNDILAKPGISGKENCFGRGKRCTALHGA